MYRNVDIDIDVYRKLEANRRSFDETPLEILRRMLGLNGAERTPAAEQGISIMRPRERPSRKRSSYRVLLDNTQIDASSLRELLKQVIGELKTNDPDFIHRLSRHVTPKGRRIVARNPLDLYKGNEELAETQADKIDDEWWFDTNVSKAQAQRYLDVISRISHASRRIEIIQTQ